MNTSKDFEIQNKNRWNNWFEYHKSGTDYDYQPWLNQYITNLPSNAKILDLGCGLGHDTQHLVSLNANYQITATDFVDSALERINKRHPSVQTLNFDLAKGDWSIFNQSQYDLIIASFSLQYFSIADTQRILVQINQLLKPSGMLVVRLNSTRDTDHGAGEGELLEPNFYIDPKHNNTKRYFDLADINFFFGSFRNLKVSERHLEYAGCKTKHFFEISCNPSIISQ
jgi:2-polyprenyl-3-methyl-5-hydroxy-6-metoxy-1,4-benzoquinol methylase